VCHILCCRTSEQQQGSQRAVVKAGMTRMRADGLTKAAQGVTQIEEIMRTTV
jgi:type II secretory ATPase GspE/PulE/Tfp pilus assembly ATPase PilB-like protein